MIRPSRGTHIVLPSERLPVRAGAIAPAPGGRTIFVLPWLGRTLVGTTDNDYDGDIERVRPAREDVDHLLDAVNAFFGTALGRGDVAGAYAGVRPLISTGDPKKSVDISRKAELYETSSGMITITGGKLTTWRRMAKLAVDRIVERDGRDGAVPHARDPARDGGRRRRACRGSRACRRSPTRSSPAATATPRATCSCSPPSGGELAQPILPGQPDLLAEAVHAARREQARDASATCCCGARGSG